MLTPEQMHKLADYLAQIGTSLSDVELAHHRAAFKRLRHVVDDLHLAAGGSTDAKHRLQVEWKRDQ